MEIIKWLVWFYAMGTAIMASWQIYIMVTKLDRFDWEYEKGHIWIEYVLERGCSKFCASLIG